MFYRRRWYRIRAHLARLCCLGFAAIIAWLLVSHILPSVSQKEPRIRLWREDVGQVVLLPLEDYVAGVLAAEMPADFSLEALKAGAVAARSYALYQMTKQQTSSGTAAHVSSNYRTSQAWISPASLLEIWGQRKYLLAWPKIKLAVTSTRGQAMTYGGQVIQALYHSTSGGVTANSEDYFASSIPYLRSTASPWEAHSPYWRTEVTFSETELLQRMGIATLDANNTTQSLVEVVDNYATGRTKRVRIGHEIVSSRQVREKLGLRSSWFTVSCVDGLVTFHIKGNGHGVGMSQYGADGLARQGYQYDAILRYYYPGAGLRKLY